MALARGVQVRTRRSGQRSGSVRGRRLRECGAFLACDIRPPCAADPGASSLRTRRPGPRACSPRGADLPAASAPPCGRGLEAPAGGGRRMTSATGRGVRRGVRDLVIVGPQRGAAARCQTPRYRGPRHRAATAFGLEVPGTSLPTAHDLRHAEAAILGSHQVPDTSLPAPGARHLVTGVRRRGTPAIAPVRARGRRWDGS